MGNRQAFPSLGCDWLCNFDVSGVGKFIQGHNCNNASPTKLEFQSILYFLPDISRKQKMVGVAAMFPLGS